MVSVIDSFIDGRINRIRICCSVYSCVSLYRYLRVTLTIIVILFIVMALIFVYLSARPYASEGPPIAQHVWHGLRRPLLCTRQGSFMIMRTCMLAHVRAPHGIRSSLCQHHGKVTTTGAITPHLLRSGMSNQLVIKTMSMNAELQLSGHGRHGTNFSRSVATHLMQITQCQYAHVDGHSHASSMLSSSRDEGRPRVVVSSPSGAPDGRVARAGGREVCMARAGHRQAALRSPTWCSASSGCALGPVGWQPLMGSLQHIWLPPPIGTSQPLGAQGLRDTPAHAFWRRRERRIQK